jgi:hypothetical protein
MMLESNIAPRLTGNLAYLFDIVHQDVPNKKITHVSKSNIQGIAPSTSVRMERERRQIVSICSPTSEHKE